MISLAKLLGFKTQEKSNSRTLADKSRYCDLHFKRIDLISQKVEKGYEGSKAKIISIKGCPKGTIVYTGLDGYAVRLYKSGEVIKNLKEFELECYLTPDQVKRNKLLDREISKTQKELDAF